MIKIQWYTYATLSCHGPSIFYEANPSLVSIAHPSSGAALRYHRPIQRPLRNANHGRVLMSSEIEQPTTCFVRGQNALRQLNYVFL